MDAVIEHAQHGDVKEMVLSSRADGDMPGDMTGDMLVAWDEDSRSEARLTHMYVVDIETCNRSGRDGGLVGVSLAAYPVRQHTPVFVRTWLIKREWSAVENKAFWEGNMVTWNKSQELGTDEKTAVTGFMYEWRHLHQRLGTTEDRVGLVSDNAEFDYGVLSHYAERYGYPILRYTLDKLYRPIRNYADVATYLGIDDVLATYAKELGAAHTHDPQDDVHYMYIGFSMMRQLRTELRETIRNALPGIVSRLNLRQQQQQQQQQQPLAAPAEVVEVATEAVVEVATDVVV